MTTIQAIPPGMTAVTPHLVCRSAAEVIAFCVRAFGAVEQCRIAGRDGRLMHAQISIGNAPLMLVDEFPDYGAVGPLALRGSPVTIHLYVADVDATVAQAVAAGARVTMPVQDMFWGDRYACLEDPSGHKWSVATHVRDVAPEEIAAAALNACPDANA